ncbi:hypothetical protein PVK06_040766 [Gossypium arboreum]|uniref:Reverse transcriptase domain-containing protein n=1 Tax=Gossypium arboreum TaxID=29729 RepID=A0ABR0N762_GOSAR|nr:hypothetical protein PVK06_040766 [Gossypium arboreum]
MAYRSDNFPINSSSRRAEMSASGAQHEKVDLFAGWFTDRLENFDNAVKSLSNLPKPPSMRNMGRKVNSRDRCAFYNDMGHKIEDCFTLKDAIEEAV